MDDATLVRELRIQEAKREEAQRHLPTDSPLGITLRRQAKLYGLAADAIERLTGTPSDATMEDCDA